MWEGTYSDFAQEVTPLPLPDAEDALAAAVHGQHVAAAVLKRKLRLKVSTDQWSALECEVLHTIRRVLLTTSGVLIRVKGPRLSYHIESSTESDQNNGDISQI